MWNEKAGIMKRYKDPFQIRERELGELKEALDEGSQVEVCLSSIYWDGEGFSLVGRYGESGIEVQIQDTDWFPHIPTKPIQMSKGNPSKISPKEWIRQQATGSMGGFFPIILLGEDGDSGFYGSRLKAMEEDRRETFFTGTTPEEGDRIMLRVVSATGRRVKVEAAGVECEIGREEMSWIYKENCKESFLAGTVLEAVIMKCDIYPDSSGVDGKVNLELSVKRAKPFYDAAWKYEVGDRELATVVSHTSWGLILDINGETTCGVDLSKKFSRPLLGQKVIVEITDVKENDDGIRRLRGSLKSRIAMRETRELVEQGKTLRMEAEKSYLEWLDLNRCVPIDVAHEYLVNFYRGRYKGKPDQDKFEEWHLAAKRILVSLEMRGIRDEGDGCHHAPREVMTISEDPKPDRLLRLSELFQIFLKWNEKEKGMKCALPVKMSDVEVLTVLESDGTVKSVAAVPNGDSEMIREWILDLQGGAFGNLDESGPEEDLYYWKKKKAVKSAGGMEQIILAEDYERLEKISEYPGGREILESSEVWVRSTDSCIEGEPEPWERIEFLPKEEALQKVS